MKKPINPFIALCGACFICILLLGVFCKTETTEITQGLVRDKEIEFVGYDDRYKYEILPNGYAHAIVGDGCIKLVSEKDFPETEFNDPNIIQVGANYIIYRTIGPIVVR